MSDELTVKVARAIVPLAYGDRENVNGRDTPAVSYDEISPDWQERWRIIASAAIDEARGWRDISSAPREQWLLTWGVDAGHTIQRIPNDLRSFWAEGVEATHWQPIPAPPKEG